jgi:hypothetical protein
LFSTFIGGSQPEEAKYICLDEKNNIFISGETWSTEPTHPQKYPLVFPVGATPELATHKVGSNAFITKLSTTGNTLLLSLLIGANNNDLSGGLALIMDDDTLKSIVVAAQISGGPAPLNNPPTTTPDAVQRTFGSGKTGYVVIINPLECQIEHASF